MILTAEKIKQFVENNPKLVHVKESTSYPGLRVIKYRKNVFWDNLWHLDPMLMECRGLIVDEGWNPVVVPFKKVFNYKENGTTIPLDSMVEVTTKVNGFMAAMTWHPRHGILISTTGSLDSPFCDMARDYLNEVALEINRAHWQVGDWAVPVTDLYEICHPKDPHIIDEVPGAYLIGSRDHLTGRLCTENELDMIGAVLGDFGVMRPASQIMTFAEALEKVKTVKHEGFMVRDLATNNQLKLKSPYYLVTKFFARKSQEKLELLLSNNSWKQVVDEEYYDVVEYIKARREEFLALPDEQARVEYFREAIDEVIYNED